MTTPRSDTRHRVGLAAVVVVAALALTGCWAPSVQRAHKWSASVPYEAAGALRERGAYDPFDRIMVAWARPDGTQGAIRDRGVMSPDIALSLVAPEIRLPSERSAGRPVEALRVPTAAPRERRRVVMRFESGIRMEAEPGWTERRLLNGLRREPRVVPTDITGVRVIVRTDGELAPGRFHGPSGRGQVPARAWFVRDSVRYAVYSEYATSAERLERVAASIIEQH